MKKLKGTLLRINYKVPGGILLDQKDFIKFIYNALSADSFTTYLSGTYQAPPFRLKYLQRKDFSLTAFISFLTEDASKIFTSQVTEWGSMKIGNISCALKQLEEISSEPLPINWGQECPDRLIILEFSTPTLFQDGQAPLPLPIPRLVWGSLIKTYETYSHMKLPEGFCSEVEKYVTIQHMQVETKAATLGGLEKVTGFVGQVHFKINPDAPLHVPQILYMLSRWAEFSGVGVKTTYGMGSVRILNNISFVQIAR